jgi:hypothetical protein
VSERRLYSLTTRGYLRDSRLHAQDLQALVLQAYDLRDGSYFRDAVAAIVERVERAPLLEFELRQHRVAELIQLLRETDPDRMPRRREAA